MSDYLDTSIQITYNCSWWKKKSVPEALVILPPNSNSINHLHLAKNWYQYFNLFFNLTNGPGWHEPRIVNLLSVMSRAPKQSKKAVF